MINRVQAILLLAVISGCGWTSSVSNNRLNQGVQGTVRCLTDYDHSDMEYSLNPPVLAPQALADATVYLLSYRGQPIQQLTSRDILDSTTTDSLGQYELFANSGTYYLAVGKSAFPAVVLQYDTADTKGLDFAIFDFSLIVIPKGQVVIKDFEVYELVPQ